ncbi:MAG: hypothetical protein P4L46_11625 [Fimbriimonas sp.]|nr:hypothetical protein [Fimbriimonas sp.]
MKIQTIAVVAFALLCSVAFAQQGPPPRDLMLTKKIFFALGPKTITEIKLTDAEKTKILDAFDGGLEVDGNRISLRLTGGQDLAAMEAEALKVLDKDQTKRLQELWIQYIGGLAIADDTVAKQLGLSDEQKKKADKLVDKGGSEASELLTGEPDPSVGKKINEIRSKYGKKILALLTDDQAKTFETLKGKPFKFGDGPQN